MRAAALRRWFHAAYLTMSSAELGVHHAALRSAKETGRFVRARLWVCSTRLAPCRAPVAPVLAHPWRPDAMALFEKRHDTAYVRWFGSPQGDVRRPPLIGASAVLLSTTRPGKHAPTTTDARTAGLRLDLTIAMRVGIRSVYVTIEVLARSARQSHGPRIRDSRDVAALRHLYRRWLASESH
jgi:hypothetical protein